MPNNPIEQRFFEADIGPAFSLSSLVLPKSLRAPPEIPCKNEFLTNCADLAETRIGSSLFIKKGNWACGQSH